MSRKDKMFARLATEQAQARAEIARLQAELASARLAENVREKKVEALLNLAFENYKTREGQSQGSERRDWNSMKMAALEIQQALRDIYQKDRGVVMQRYDLHGEYDMLHLAKDAEGDYVLHSEAQTEIARLQILLGRYSLHVANCEGTDFINGSHHSGFITEEECAEIKTYQGRL